jgi:hypothetical protein
MHANGSKCHWYVAACMHLAVPVGCLWPGLQHASGVVLSANISWVQRCKQGALQQVAEELRQSTKQLCRNLKDNPNVADNMAKVCGHA